MINFYAMRVEAKIMLWTKVPTRWFIGTCERVKEDGYVLNEDGTVTKIVPEPVEPAPVVEPEEEEVEEVKEEE